MRRMTTKPCCTTGRSTALLTPMIATSGALMIGVDAILNARDELRAEALASFEAAISNAPEVMEAYLMTGRADYVLRVVVADLDAYERFLMRRLTRIPGVSQIESSFMLRQVAARSALPVPSP